MKRLEDKIQISFIDWINKQYPKFSGFVFHIPNGGKMSIIAGARLKKMGVRKGVADILFMWKTEDFGGLFLEFKTNKGRQTAEQIDFENNCHVAQYDYQVVRSLEEAIVAFKRYMNHGILLKKPLPKNWGKVNGRQF